MYHAACKAEFQPFDRSCSNFLLTIIDFEHFIILVQQSCLVLLFSLNIIILVQLWVADEKAQPSSGHMREKRPYPSEVIDIYLIVLNVVAYLACWCRGKTLCLTTLMTFKIPDIA